MTGIYNYLPYIMSTSFSTYGDVPPGYELSFRRDEDMIVWKKACTTIGYYDKIGSFYIIIKLKIPKDADVVFTPDKCRASRAVVLGFYSYNFYGEQNQLDIPYAVSLYDRSFRYELGEEVVPDYFDRNPCRTCSNGIHFFRSYREAVKYIF